MKVFNEKRAEFLRLVEPIIGEGFSDSQEKTVFIKKWREVVEGCEFCKTPMSYMGNEIEKNEQTSAKKQEY